MAFVWSSSQGIEGPTDLDMIKGLIEDALFSCQPAMILNLKTYASSPLVRNVCVLPAISQTNCGVFSDIKSIAVTALCFCRSPRSIYQFQD